LKGSVQKGLEKLLSEYSDDEFIHYTENYWTGEVDKTIMLELVKRLKKALEGRS